MTTAVMIRSLVELYRRRAWSLALLASLCVVLASCGGSSSNSTGSSAAPTATLTATPSTVTAGSSTSVTLAFTSTNATSGSLSGQGSVGTGGNISIPAPSSTTQYVYTATGPGGTTAASATVTVTPAPVVNSFTVNPGTILEGGAVTLSWNSTNAAFVVINANVGASPGRVGASGTNVSIPSPSQTTTYTAVATTSSGAQSAGVNATLTVNPITSFNGLDSSVAGGSTEDDIDPNGAVGTKQYMEYVNTSYQGYDKTTFAPVWSTPQPINTPWPSSSPCAAVGANGPAIQLDAVIIFDRLASRWVIAAKTTVQDDYNFCIAVSNTDDLTSPTFAWYAYSWNIDNALGKSANGHYYQPDWPKLGTWSDGYYAAMDLINTDPSSEAESGVLICAFDRTNMLANTTSTPAFACYEDLGTNTTRLSNGIYLAHSLIPADVDGITPPPAGRDEFMVSIQNPQDPDDASGSIISTTINLWDFHIDWTSPATLTLENLSTPAVNTYTPGCYTPTDSGETICVPEMGVAGIGGIKIDSVGDRLMPRFAYRNFSSAATPYESFLISHTVQTDLGMGQEATQTGVRWYELRGNGSGTPSLAQQGTITPDSVYYRFLPSIAEDKNGNAAAGYSISNPSSNPGISLSYWNLNPVNANQPQEVTILNGPGEEIPLTLKQGQNPNLGQWGSYADISVDPTDDCTFWYVNEYWPANTTGAPGPWATNISNFQLPGCQ